MEQQINELKQLRANLAHWQEQKYYDDQARQEAMMNGRRHNQKVTEKITHEIQQATAAVASFELWNYDVVEALNEMEEVKAKAKTEQAIKSVLNN